jgi:nucleotide-binding universal stress UspA family protein
MRLAADLAHRHDARMIVLYVEHRTEHQSHRLKAAELGLLPADKLDELEHLIDGSVSQMTAKLHDMMISLQGDHGLDVEWRCVAGENTAQVVAQHARYADLTIVGHNPRKMEELPYEYSFAETMLFTVGRPLIIVPTTATTQTLGQRVAIGWNASRPAARAITDALSIIERAERTVLLTVNAEEMRKRGGLPVEMMVENLRRHGASVEAMQTELAHSEIGDGLQAQARAAGADLLVIGAYGHPKLWEKLLGGVTRDLLARTVLPILMAT